MHELQKQKKDWESLFFYNEERFQSGLNMARDAAKNWNQQTNPGKVYVLGRRVHHGTFGVGLIILALLSKDSFGLGYAYGLIEDDIDDAPHWFDFEKGGNPNSLVSIT